MLVLIKDYFFKGNHKNSEYKIRYNIIKMYVMYLCNLRTRTVNCLSTPYNIKKLKIF